MADELFSGNLQRVTLTQWKDGLWSWETHKRGVHQFKTAEEALKAYEETYLLLKPFDEA